MAQTQQLQLKWVGISLLVFLAAQLVVNLAFVVFGLMTLGIGFLLFVIAKPVAYFLGGYITGRLSPGITIREPAIGAVIITVLGTLFDATRSSDGGILGMVISGLVAFFVALWGARLGERA
jgi:hypothetical protein